MRKFKTLAALLIAVMLLSLVAISVTAAAPGGFTGSPSSPTYIYDEDQNTFLEFDNNTGDYVQIDDADVPLTGSPDGDAGAADAEDTLTIEDEEVPLAALPAGIPDVGDIAPAAVVADEGTTKAIITGDQLTVSTDGTGKVRLEERVDEKTGETSNVIVVDLTTEESDTTEADVTISENVLTAWSEAVEPVELQLDMGTVTLQPEASRDLAKYVGNVRFLLTQEEKAIVNETGDSYTLDEVEDGAKNEYAVTVPDPGKEDAEVTISGLKVDLSK